MKTLITILMFVWWAGLPAVAPALPEVPKAHKEPFSIAISAVDPVQPEGYGVAIRVRLTNMSDRKISGSGTYGYGADLGFEYSVRRVGGVALRRVKHEGPLMGSFRFSTLGPGESMEEVTDIGHLYNFTPGKYAIQLWRSISTNPGAGVVKSNTIQVTILPPDFSVAVEAPKGPFKAGSQISVMVRLTNTSGHPMAISVLPGGELDPNYVCWCYNSAGKAVMRDHIRGKEAGTGRTQILKPGKSYDELVPISAACDLSKPGEYRVLLFRQDANDPEHRSVKSNEIKIKVVP
jgi:hypothetical protein